MNTGELTRLWTPQRIAFTTISGVDISTVYTPGLGYAETMIFLNLGPVEGLQDQDGDRTGCVENAQAQHDEWVAKVRAAASAFPLATDFGQEAAPSGESASWSSTTAAEQVSA